MVNVNQFKYNYNDSFIILAIISAIMGTTQIGIIGHTFLLGVICLPFALLEIFHACQTGKFKPIVLFMVIWLAYAIISIFWGRSSQDMMRELWNLWWNIIIFLGLYHAGQKAPNAQKSFLTGWRSLICLTLIIAAWEIITDSHLAGVGDFNVDAEIAADRDTQHRIFAAVTYKNLNSYVTLLCMALPFLIHGIFKLPFTWLSISIVFGSICVLLVNASRGGLMCLTIDLFILCIFYKRLHFPNKKIITFFMSIGLALFISLYGVSIAEQSIGRLSAYGLENIMQDAGRWEVWKKGIEFCIESFGFGCGVGSMQQMYKSTGGWLHYSHNFVIEFIIQYGCWLFIPFGIILVKNWKCLIKTNDVNLNILGWMISLSFVPLAIIDDSYLSHSYVWIWLVTQLALTQYTDSTTKDPQEHLR